MASIETTATVTISSSTGNCTNNTGSPTCDSLPSSSPSQPHRHPMFFRSILPHEPPPIPPSNLGKEHGYLHIQGALTPKFVSITPNPPTPEPGGAPPRHPGNDTLTEEPKEHHNDDDHKVTTTTPTTTTINATAINNEQFWMEHRTAFEQLLLLQFRAFHCHYCPSTQQQQQQQQQQQKAQDPNNMEPQSLQLLDTVPPFTKIRLQYTTTQAAQVALYGYRKHHITARQLLLLQILPDGIEDQLEESFYTDAMKLRSQLLSSLSQSSQAQADDTTGGKDKILIPDRLLQITEITNRPLLYRPAFIPSNHTTTIANGTSSTTDIDTAKVEDKELLETICWTRSNPPKFRRLIARPYEEEQYIEQQRQSTRFIVITNLLPPLPIVTTAVVANEENAAEDNVTIPPLIPKSQPPQLIHEMWEQDPVSIAYAIRSVFNQYDTSGYGIEVFVPNQINKRTRYCHIGMRSSHDAQRVIQSLQETTVQWPWIGYENNLLNGKICEPLDDTVQAVTSGKLFIDYAAITQRSMSSKVDATTTSTAGVTSSLIEGMDPSSLLLGHPSRPQCTSTTDDIHIPGLIVVTDYISAAEEEVLMAILTGPQAPWAPSQKTASYVDGTVRRMVQHYGYVFDYQTANVLRDRTISNSPANCPPMPAIISNNESDCGSLKSQSVNDHAMLESYIEKCIHEGRGWEVLAGIIERTRRYPFVVDNDNNPAEKDHRDTNTITFPNLNQLTVNHYKPGEGIGSHVDTPSAFADGLISISLNSGIVMEFRNVKDPKQRKKLVYLPPRSMLLMSKDARYDWEHMIVTRMTDTYNDVVLPRKLRVSLTLRTALSEDGTSYLPLVESNRYPPIWNEPSFPSESTTTTTVTTTTSSALATPACERDHVHKVYDAIATQWHHTRGKRGVLWPGATQFLQRLSPGSIVADVGCGDGKYFPAIWEAGSFVIGSDISEPLLRTAIHDTTSDEVIPENCRVSDHRQHLRNHPAVIVADCMSVPLRTSSCDAAICIAVLHHLSTLARRKRCIEELVRIVKPGGLVNVQAWALEQEDGSRRKFASNDVFVPFNAQPKYLKLNGSTVDRKATGSGSSDTGNTNVKSTAQIYSEALNAEYDEGKGLVVFQRYCHLYRLGELEEIVAGVSGAMLVDSGFESGNYFIIFQVEK